MLNVVRAKLGYRDGQWNSTKFGQWYAKTEFAKRYAAKYQDEPEPEVYQWSDWCAIFLIWAAVKVGLKVPADALTFGMAQEFKAAKQFSQTPEVGSFAFFGGSGHVGIVETVDGGGWFTDIEGNHDDTVERVRRNVEETYGFGRPDYAPPVLGTETGAAARVKASYDYFSFPLLGFGHRRDGRR